MNSILTFKESEVTQFIIKQFGEILFEKLGIDQSVKIFYNINGIVDKGDLDLLILDPSAPQKSLIFE